MRKVMTLLFSAGMAGLFVASSASAAPVAVASTFQNGLVDPFGDGTELYRGVEDTYLNGGSTTNATRNNGGATVMVGNNARGNLALIRFDLTSMQGQYDHITSASLIVRATSGNAANFNALFGAMPSMNIYAITAPNGNWVAGTANNATVNDGSSTFGYMQYWGPDDPENVSWGSGPGLGINMGDASTPNMQDTSDPANWGFGPIPLGTVTYNPANQEIQFKIPNSLIEQWINGTNYGIVLTVAATRDEDGNITSSPIYSQVPTFYTSQQGADGNAARPRLVVSYVVPEPMTGSLLLIGGLMVAMRRRPRQA